MKIYKIIRESCKKFVIIIKNPVEFDKYRRESIDVQF